MSITLKNPTSESLLNELNQVTASQQNTPGWLKSIQKNNAEQLSSYQFPTRKTEHWKYNDIANLKDKRFELSQKKMVSQSQLDSLLLALNDAIQCVFVNGKFSKKLSSVNPDSAVEITQFINASEQQIKIINRSLTQAQQTRNPFITMNNALSDDGLLIEIKKNQQIKKPIYLVHLFSADDIDQISTNQTIIQCGLGSQSQVIEHFISIDNVPASKSLLSSQQTIIELSDNSHIEHHRVTIGDESKQSISRILCRLADNANLTSFYYSEGGLLDKTDIDIMHQGPNSESYLTGIYLPCENKNVDFHTCIEHQVPHCTSRVTFRGIIADSAKATFNGKIHIFRDAQKSDAQLNNKNLLLTNTAEINTKPELEIYADDVVCAHGATIAKIDEKAIYYLKSGH